MNCYRLQLVNANYTQTVGIHCVYYVLFVQQFGMYCISLTANVT